MVISFMWHWQADPNYRELTDLRCFQEFSFSNSIIFHSHHSVMTQCILKTKTAHTVSYTMVAVGFEDNL